MTTILTFQTRPLHPIVSEGTLTFIQLARRHRFKHKSAAKVDEPRHTYLYYLPAWAFQESSRLTCCDCSELHKHRLHCGVPTWSGGHWEQLIT